MKKLANPYERNRSNKYIPPPKEDEAYLPKTVKKSSSKKRNLEDEINVTPLHTMPGVRSKVLNQGLPPGVPHRPQIPLYQDDDEINDAYTPLQQKRRKKTTSMGPSNKNKEFEDLNDEIN